MINIEILQEMHKLCGLYEERWHKPVDYIGMPSNMSQERLLLILRYIADTGDSVLVGAQKIRDICRKYQSELADALSAQTMENDAIFNIPCPLCGNKVRFMVCGNSYSCTCDTKFCYNENFRGI